MQLDFEKRQFLSQLISVAGIRRLIDSLLEDEGSLQRLKALFSRLEALLNLFPKIVEPCTATFPDIKNDGVEKARIRSLGLKRLELGDKQVL